MIELSRGPRLLLEAVQPPRLGGERTCENLDRDGSANRGVPRPIDLGKPARLQWLDDLVSADERSGRERHEPRRGTKVMARFSIQSSSVGFSSTRRPLAIGPLSGFPFPPAFCLRPVTSSAI